MEEIMDKLCLKRLCYPSNTDINLVRNGFIKYKMCECDTIKHISVCLRKNTVFNILSYGTNIYDKEKNGGSVHAEINAINNLPNSTNKKKLIKIDLLVIRTSNTGKIGMSKPCVKCIIDLSTIPLKKGYIIKNIYYSDNESKLIKTNLKKLQNDDNLHISRYYINHNITFSF